jgi:hypothetical protein
LEKQEGSNQFSANSANYSTVASGIKPSSKKRPDSC